MSYCHKARYKQRKCATWTLFWRLRILVGFFKHKVLESGLCSRHHRYSFLPG